MESELFGHERGAFTGAIQRKIGKFEQAHTGTIFLDEIGEMDMSLQVKLLRVIQTKQFERVGGNETLSSDIRIISATNRNLRELILIKEFREDLYYRLATFPIYLPSLRERRSDILLLSEHFLKQFSQSQGKGELMFSRQAIKILYDYPWPGNIRELENAIERAVLLTERNVVTEQELPLALQAFARGDDVVLSSSPFSANGDAIIPFEKIKEEAIRHAFKVTEGNMVETARKLKIARSTLYELMKKYNIQTASA
jgi:DNA-binding NtrC family response regulator